jgi:lactate permease
MIWPQNYDPLRNVVLSTVAAGLPLVILLWTVVFLRLRIHRAALLGLGSVLALAVGIWGMPLAPALAATAYGAAYGLLPIGWIVLNLIFLYDLTVERGLFDLMRRQLGALAPDPRVQAILIAFSFGAFFEGTAGFGTPVALTAAILIQLGFRPLEASMLALMGNTAPVAYAGLGTPVIALSAVTNLDLRQLSATVGGQVAPFAALVPFWMVWALAGWRGMLEVWPVALTAGLGFALPQYWVARCHGPWLVDIVAALCSMAAVAGLLCFWRPKRFGKPSPATPLTGPPGNAEASPCGEGLPISQSAQATKPSLANAPALRSQGHWRDNLRAWMPWAILTIVVFCWGIPQVKRVLDGEGAARSMVGEHRARFGPTRVDVAVPCLHLQVRRQPPVAVPDATPEKAIFSLNWLSATGTGILVAALLAGAWMGFGLGELVRRYGRTLVRLRHSLVTIAAMMALGHVARYAGTDATLGLALAHTGLLYPFFGAWLGWLGVALTGSDTASNVLFGNLQCITAGQTGFDPLLMSAANASGGMMGKMVAGQSLVVASTATNWYGHEGAILRRVFWHSVVLAALVGGWVYLQAQH